MKLIILGAGKYGKEIEDVAEQMDRFDRIDFLDDFATWDRVIGKCSDFNQHLSENTAFFVAFGDNEMRARWLKALMAANATIVNIVHPSAYISPKASLGNGVAILPKALVNSHCVIENGRIINSGAIVDHDTTIGEYAHVCVGAIVKADNKIPAFMKVEAGNVIERFTYR